MAEKITLKTERPVVGFEHCPVTQEAGPLDQLAAAGVAPCTPLGNASPCLVKRLGCCVTEVVANLVASDLWRYGM